MTPVERFENLSRQMELDLDKAEQALDHLEIILTREEEFGERV
jgi:hypothetical protein